jgi:F0F1-type ATP synthase membrane subunit c/vacuolar-type H+-ATPase subunit K
LENIFMKKVIALVLVGLAVASCTQTEKGAGIGAVSGAVIGSVSEQPGQCYYRDRYGRRYIDRCPSGY